MSASDEEDKRRRKLPLFLLAVTNNGAIVAACRAALKTMQGVQLRHFTDPHAALEWASKNDPVAVVVDQKLPSMDGSAFIRHLHGSASLPRPHVIMLSEEPHGHATEAARDIGVDDVIQTSAPRSSFVSLVQSAIGLRLAERTLWERDAVLEQRVASAQPSQPSKLAFPRRLAAEAALVIVLLLLLGAVLKQHHELPFGSSSSAAAPSSAAADSIHRPSASGTSAAVSSRTVGDQGQGDVGSPHSASSGQASSPAGDPSNAGETSPGSPPPSSVSSGGNIGLGTAVAAPGGDVSAGNGQPPRTPSEGDRKAADAARPLTKDSNSGFLVLDSAGRPISAYNADVPRVPASTVKVMTAAAAIATLGAQFRFTTEIVAHGAVRDGTIDGTLALVGGGDPVFSRANLESAVSSLERRGVRDIRGDLLIDGTAFTPPEYNTNWAAADRSQPYAAGTSAVSIDEGVRQNVVDGAPTAQAVDDQQAYAGLLLSNLLSAHHIKLDGATRYGRSQGGTILWKHESPPLSALVYKMLRESDNHIAEQILRETGLVASGVGSESAGIAQVHNYLAQRRISVAGLQLYDGSGLSLNNRVTPRTLATLLWRIGGTPEGEQIHASLPAVEKQGDIEERTPEGARDLLLAKTGRVSTARGLAGYLDRGPEGSLSFAFLATEGRDAASHALQESQERLLHSLGRLTQ